MPFWKTRRPAEKLQHITEGRKIQIGHIEDGYRNGFLFLHLSSCKVAQLSVKRDLVGWHSQKASKGCDPTHCLSSSIRKPAQEPLGHLAYRFLRYNSSGKIFQGTTKIENILDFKSENQGFITLLCGDCASGSQ